MSFIVDFFFFRFQELLNIVSGYVAVSFSSVTASLLTKSICI